MATKTKGQLLRLQQQVAAIEYQTGDNALSCKQGNGGDHPVAAK
jgi:hypothetical protein